MKKTVSWHTETLPKQEDAQDDADQSSAQPPTRSSGAAPAPVTNPQVNARIQQMVAMQRAQNASMRQMMSSNTYGGAAASPSGLRDIVTTSLPQQGKSAQPATSSSAVASDDTSPPSNDENVTKFMAPMKPPAALPADDNHDMDKFSNINYQGPLKHSLPTNHRATPSPIMQNTPPLLYPKYPYPDGHDSPVSYNSVLDQNLTPSKVKERKKAQQLQTIQSQHQMERSESIEASSIPLQPSPTSKLDAVDWGSMQPTTDGYTMKPIPQHSDYGAMSSLLQPNIGGPTIKDTMAKPAASFPQARTLQHDPMQQYKVATDQLSLLDNNNNNNGAAHTQHQFHYGDNPPQMPHSYHDSSNTPHSLMGKDIHFPMGDIELRELQQRSRRRRRNLLCQILCYPIQYLYTSEQVGRSFCFGAIDGMLTGSGILAAYIGLGILSHANAFGTTDTSSYEADMHRKWILVALTFAACFSDGVCMAIGHIWSTRLVAGASFEERKEELRSFETSRSDAKARLVDALLLNGVLKIDAMSLADTLEGYPDLFVSALLGEGLCGASAARPSSMGGLGSGAGGAGAGGLIRIPSGNASNKPVYNPAPAAWNIPAPAYAPGVMAHEGLKYESYSEFSDLHQDPDVKTFSEIMSESRLESFFMMLSFGSFSVIPSLVYTFAPYIANALGAANGRNMDALAISVSGGVTSIVMFLLGAWKSQFYNSNWCMYGVETVGVFAVCVVCAFLMGIGAGSVINSAYQ